MTTDNKPNTPVHSTPVNFSFDAQVFGFDVTISGTAQTVGEVLLIAQEMKRNDFLPKPRFSKGGNDAKPFEPTLGEIIKVEDTKTSTGKDMFIAHVMPEKKDENDKPETLLVKYMPPKNTWRVGDKVRVTKNEKGWMELHEQEDHVVIPF